MTSMTSHSLMARFIAGVLLIPALVAGVYAADQAAGKAIGEVTYLKGKVSIFNAAAVERVAVLKMAVFLNEKVSCGAGSKVEIRFNDESVISIGEQSEMVVDQYVYSPDAKKEVSFVMRMFKGVCRIATGAITKMNPDRFKVHTRMATVGIRGCDLGISSKQEKDDVYVIKLGKQETVVVETTSNGKPMMDMATGKALVIDDAVRKVVNVERAGCVVSVTEGKGFIQRELNAGEMNELTRGTSHAPAARYEPVFGSDLSTIEFKPEKAAPQGKKD